MLGFCYAQHNPPFWIRLPDWDRDIFGLGPNCCLYSSFSRRPANIAGRAVVSPIRRIVGLLKLPRRILFARKSPTLSLCMVLFSEAVINGMWILRPLRPRNVDESISNWTIAVCIEIVLSFWWFVLYCFCVQLIHTWGVCVHKVVGTLAESEYIYIHIWTTIWIPYIKVNRSWICLTDYIIYEVSDNVMKYNTRGITHA